MINKVKELQVIDETVNLELQKRIDENDKRRKGAEYMPKGAVKEDYFDFLESVGVSCEKPRKVPTPLPKDDYPRIKGITNDDFESFVAFDFETTGTNSNQDAIIEVGAIKVIDGKIIESKEYIFQEFVKPYKKKIPEKIKEITGIDNADVENARDMWEVIPDFMEFVGDLPLVGFNSNAFDCRFLERAGRYSHIIIKNDSFDVMTYANSFKKELNIKKERCSLADLSVALSITNPQAHRALADAITTAKVFIELKRR